MLRRHNGLAWLFKAVKWNAKMLELRDNLSPLPAITEQNQLLSFSFGCLQGQHSNHANSA
jgi:hypothetical protein